jgi:hypothetical protein
MNIAFSGHRNRVTDIQELAKIAAEFQGAVWVHGGAAGFDAQVAEYATAHRIPERVLPPDYETYGRVAPFVRTREIVSQADLLVACWDGREKGGTAEAIRCARKRGIPVRFLPAVDPQGQSRPVPSSALSAASRSQRAGNTGGRSFRSGRDAMPGRWAAPAPRAEPPARKQP